MSANTHKKKRATGAKVGAARLTPPPLSSPLRQKKVKQWRQGVVTKGRKKTTTPPPLGKETTLRRRRRRRRRRTRRRRSRRRRSRRRRRRRRAPLAIALTDPFF